MSLQFGFLWRVCTDVTAGIPLLFNNHDHIGGREDRNDLLWVCCRSSHPTPVAVLLFKPHCLSPCLGRWLLFPPDPLQKGLTIPGSQPRRVVITVTIVMWSHLVCRLNECLGAHRKHLKGQGQWTAWINDHHLRGSFVQDTCPGYPSFPADNVLCILLSICYCVQSWCSAAQPWPPLICTRGAANKQLQVKGAGRMDLGSLLTLLCVWS